MGKIDEYIEIETLHSSWIRNMFQMVSIGIILITLFKSHHRLRNFYIIPILIILIGIIIGIYSIYFTYFTDIDNLNIIIKKHNTWKYISILTCGIFIFVAVYIIKYFK